MLTINSLSASFGSKKILNNISLTVKRGEVALLIGASGTGKSTLLRVLSNLETYNKGSITLDNTTINHNMHTVGMVFQQFNLFEHLNVTENITLALEKTAHKTTKEAHTIAKKLLEQYGLAHKASSYIQELSGGQKQRLAIARTLALKPTIICMDEPTSALDPLLAGYVAKNIQELAAQGYIILVASHDTRLLKNITGTIYLMKNGTIVETSSTNDFKKNPAHYKLIEQFIAGHKEEE